MSEVTKKALFSTLTNGAAFTALLGTDENGDPAIFNTSMNELSRVSGWSLPATTFREGPGSADGRFKEATVDREMWEFEIWADTESGVTIPAIAAELDRLLHNQVITLESGENYDCVRVSQNPDLYDEKRKLHFGLFSYRLISGR